MGIHEVHVYTYHNARLVVSDHSCAHQVQSVCFNGGVCVDGDPLTCNCDAVDFDGEFCENGEI